MTPTTNEAGDLAARAAGTAPEPFRSSRRGRLRVYLGAAPGVGKTFAMLQSAAELQRQGVDLRVGSLDCAGRTEPLQARLAALPGGRDAAGGLDLDALLARPPALLLIDRLAGANPPGSRHAQRWQDVQELLAAGIDVHTTLDVLHLESLKNRVEALTGQPVAETVPDWLLEEAHEVLLIDCLPAELPDHVFDLSTLAALRALALQVVAGRADSEVQRRYRPSGRTAPAVLGRLLVAVDGDEQAEQLVRHASRVARRRQLPWSLVHVDDGRARSAESRQRLQAARQLAERLGGEVVGLLGEEVAGTLLRHVLERRASVLLVGSRRRGWFGRGVVERLLRQGRGLEIDVLAAEEAPAAPAFATHGHAAGPFDYGLALLATLSASLAAWGLSRVLALPNISLVFLVAVLLVAVRSGLGPALCCALLSFVAYDLLFVSPTFSLTVQHHADVLTLLFFLFMAMLTGNLATRQRRQMQVLREAQAETAALLELTRKLSAATDRRAVLAVAVEQFAAWPDLDVCLLGSDGAGGLRVEAGVAAGLGEAERAAAEWVWQHELPAGLGTDTLPGGRWWWWPLSGEEGPLALLGIAPRDRRALSASRRGLLVALCQPLAQALARAQLAEELQAARLRGETEQLRSALLASVSHDLRTPLTVMHGAIDSLLTLDGQIGAADRRELLESTRDEAARLDRYIQNLLDMTRLGHGGLKLERDWVAPADIVASSLQRLRPLLAPFVLETRIPEELPLLHVHAALIEQALVNVLENAARFSPPGGRLRVAVESDGAELRLSVSDQGPGIPPAEREKIFDMFYTAARGDRGGPGTGLGLAICQGILGAHGGRVTVGEGLDGQGATLSLHLPLPLQPPGDAEHEYEPVTAS
ncbi:sensor histidine kinase KdpD [Azotobacter chroococcum subsp. isscasi]|uniref:ATP-binding protein n=1 Tax=Azotobacter chroococcum TaxID=353 RepID=UPI001038BB90|nr:ATP-binding protein [Azotobacter chroococcum]TBW07676.1 sensor histidine kinase KdpD [Azotobacter chroococcum subsp. isscasi]